MKILRTGKSVWCYVVQKINEIFCSLRYVFAAVDPRSHGHFVEKPLNDVILLEAGLVDELRNPTVVARRIAKFTMNTVGGTLATS